MNNHELMKRILKEFHESWMDDEDKEYFDAEIIKNFGAQIDADIDAVIANGYTVQQQDEIVRSLFRNFGSG